MTRFVAFLKRIWSLIKRFVNWIQAMIGRIIGGVLGPPWRALKRTVAAIKERIENIVERLLDWWDRIWRKGNNGERVKEQRNGANGAPLLAVICLAIVWYLMPFARWFGFGKIRFIVTGFVLWFTFLIYWLSQCRSDRRGRIATFAQNAYRPIGLRRLDQICLGLAGLLGYLTLRQWQLLPLSFGCIIAFAALLLIQEERPAFSIVQFFETPDVSNTDEQDQQITPIDPASSLVRDFQWEVFAHGRYHTQRAKVVVRRSDLDTANNDHPIRADLNQMVDWVLHGTGPEVISLAHQIQKQCFALGLSVFATVSAYVAACQTTQYVHDLESTGHEDYWRYPIQTIAERKGDCEDSAILLAALLRRAGYRCALFILPGHAAVGVEAGNDVGGGYFEHNDVRYFYCETTDSGWTVGAIPDGIDTKQITLIPIPEWHP